MAKETESTLKLKMDISELKSAVQEANRQIKLANAEFKAASAGVEDWGKNTEAVAAKQKQLDTVIKNQETILASYKKQLALIVQEQGENSKAADNMRIKIANQEAAVKTTRAEIARYDNVMQELRTAENQAENATDELSKSMSEVDDNTKQAEGGIDTFSAALGGFVAGVAAKAVEILADLALKMVDVAKESINVGMQFDKSMSNVKAISGATEEEFDKLQAKAMEMGKKTSFSASQAADAFGYMAMAGWKTEDMLDGIEGIMNLAAASGEELATTSDIVTDALTGFGLKAEDAGHFADVLAVVSSNASTNVSLMGETFKYVAPVASSLGVSAEDAAESIGLMANANIKASQAGTALRSILTRLATNAGASSKSLGALDILTEELGVDFYDSEGKVRDFSDILDEARTAWGKLSQEDEANFGKKIAGQEGMSAWLALMKASQSDIDKLRTSLDNADGTAASMADTMLDNLGGAMTLIQSQIEVVQLAIYRQLEPALRSVSEITGGILDFFSFLSNPEGMSFDAVIERITGGFESLSDNIQAFFDNVLNTNQFLPQIINVLSTIGSKVVELIMSAVPKLYTVLYSFATSLIKQLPNIYKKFFDEFPTFFKQFVENFLSFQGEVVKAATELFSAIATSMPQVYKLVKENLGDLIKMIVTTIADALPEMVENSVTMFTGIVDAIAEILPEAVDMMIGLLESLIDVITDPEISEKLIEAEGKIFDALLQALPPLVESIGNALIRLSPVIMKGALQLFSGLIKGIQQAGKNALKNIPTMMKSIISAFGNFAESMKEVGKNLLVGLWNGIVSNADWLKEKVSNFASGITKSIKAAFKIKSPSRVMRDEIGKYLALGIASGIESNAGAVSEAIQALTADATKLDFGLDKISGRIVMGASGAIGNTTNTTNNTSSYVFNQYNTSPKALSRLDIYRQTNNLLTLKKGAYANA